MFAVVAEFIGTFFFLSTILAVGQPIAVAAGLLAAVYAFGGVSGGHFNPAVTTMMLAKGEVDVMTFLYYVIAQVLGGLAALLWYQSTKSK